MKSITNLIKTKKNILGGEAYFSYHKHVILLQN